MRATINFSDGSTVTVNETDKICPVILSSDKDGPIAGLLDPVPAETHVHYGLTWWLLGIFCRCDYFYINEEFSIAYCSKAIVSITTDLP
ncbi:MAG: hypothetical protein NC517_09990 [Firmicutes bacterium]|nr:hypothetical protein [Bacillota bacterium]